MRCRSWGTSRIPFTSPARAPGSWGRGRGSFCRGAAIRFGTRISRLFSSSWTNSTELREARAARNAKEREALRSSLDRDDEAFRSGPDGRKRLARGPRTCEAPVKRLELPLLYAIPRGAESGFLQRRDEKTGRYLTSTLLGRGAWALATCLLRESLFCEGAKATLDLGVLEEALEASGIPIGKRASMSSYLTQLRRGLREVLGAKLGPRAIHVRKGTEVVEIRGLQVAVRVVGGSMVCPVR